MSIKSFIIFNTRVDTIFFSRSQLKSPAMVFFLFSSTILQRNSLKYCRNLIFKSGWRYHVETKIGLLFRFLISTHNVSKCSKIRSLR